MIALSIRQPWAGAVALGWKPVENRGRMLSHRGLFLIHAGQRLAADYQAAEDAFAGHGLSIPAFGMPGESPAWAFGAIVGVAELHAAHRGCDGSCAPGWAQRGQVHHVIRNARPLRRPVPCPGRLFPFTPEPEVLDLVREVWPR